MINPRYPDQREYDVAIIGSGAGCGTLAYVLARPGHDVVLVEKGDFLPAEANNRSEQGVFSGNNDSLEEGSRYPATIHASVGGETRLYGASLYRLRRENFRKLSNSPMASLPHGPSFTTNWSPFTTRMQGCRRVFLTSILDNSVT